MWVILKECLQRNPPYLNSATKIYSNVQSFSIRKVYGALLYVIDKVLELEM